MKKMIWICCTPFILFVMIVAFSLITSTQLKFKYETVKGDFAYEKKVNFNIDFQSIVYNYGLTYNNIHIKAKEGKTAYTIDAFDYDAKEDYDILTLSGDLSNGVSEYSYRDAGGNGFTCEVKKEALESTPVTYHISLQNIAGDDFTNPYRKTATNTEEIILKTDMTYVSDDEMQLYTVWNDCDEWSEDVKGIDKVYKDEEKYYVEGATAKKYQGSYYIMPVSDEHMQGSNAIYRLKFVKNTENPGYFKDTIETIVKLPETRYYDKMIQEKESLYVLSRDTSYNYLSEYDLNGNLMLETKSQLNDSNPSTIEKITEDRIIAAINDEKRTYLIYDRKTLDLIQKIQAADFIDTEGNASTPLDISYKDESLYLLIGVYESENASNLKNVQVYVLKEDEMLYKGKMNLIDSPKHREDLGGSYTGYFEEGTV